MCGDRGTQLRDLAIANFVFVLKEEWTNVDHHQHHQYYTTRKGSEPNWFSQFHGRSNIANMSNVWVNQKKMEGGKNIKKNEREER